MKLWSSPKTWLFVPSKISGNSPRGTSTLITIFVFFIFSTLGLGLLYLTQVSMKLSAYKKNSLLLDCACENGVKRGFHRLLSGLYRIPVPFMLSFEETEELHEDTREGGLLLIRSLLGNELSHPFSERWERMTWSNSIGFSSVDVREAEDYIYAKYKGSVQATGCLNQFPPCHKAVLESSLGIYCGRLPLPVIPLPLFIQKKLDHEERDEFL